MRTFEQEVENMNSVLKKMILKEAKETGKTFREVAEMYILPPILIQSNEDGLFYENIGDEKGYTEEEISQLHPRSILIS